jgi:Outer membrane protein (porin)
MAAIGLIAYASAAFAAEPGITLYGVVDTGISYTRVQDAEKTPRQRTGLTTGGLSDSLIGMKGQEALAGGWLATFQLESMIDATTGSLADPSRFFDSNAWVGLANDQFGEIRFGRQRLAGQQFGSLLEIASWKDMPMGATFKASDNYQVDNTVNYLSPSWAGFSFGAGYSFDAIGGQINGRKSPVSSVALKYENGPLLAVATWDKAYLSTPALRDPVRPQAWQLGAAYDFGVAKVSLAWSRQKDGYVGLDGGDPDNLGLGLGATEFVRGGRLDAYLAGLSIPVGASSSVVAQWSVVKPHWRWQDGENAATGHVATLGYIYNLSSRSRLYAMAGVAKRYSLDDQVVQNQGTTVRYMAGLNHSF